MTGEGKKQGEEQLSLHDLFEVYDQLAPWDQYRLHVFLNAELPQDKPMEAPVDWLIFKTQIRYELLSGMEAE
jgi:hypothetical protein